MLALSQIFSKIVITFKTRKPKLTYKKAHNQSAISYKKYAIYFILIYFIYHHNKSVFMATRTCVQWDLNLFDMALHTNLKRLISVVILKCFVDWTFDGATNNFMYTIKLIRWKILNSFLKVLKNELSLTLLASKVTYLFLVVFV